MNTAKLLEAAAELDAEAARCKGLADEIRALVKRNASNGAAHPAAIQPRQPTPRVATETTTSQLVIAVDLLTKMAAPIHVKDLVPMVAERRPGFETTRATVESALVRGMQGRYKGVLKRTGPGTFTVEKTQ